MNPELSLGNKNNTISSSSSMATTTTSLVNKALLPAFRPRTLSSSSSSSSDMNDLFEFCGVIGPANVEGMTACPCCNRPRQSDDNRETLNEPMITTSKSWPTESSSSSSSRSSNNHTSEQEADDDDILPGVLARGVEYHPKRILVEGWVHKKGTGNDFFGSRGWKPRWARLALAKVDGYDWDIPLLLIYWYRSSTYPSTVILLESTVVLAVDKETPTTTTTTSSSSSKQLPPAWNNHRFEIRHVVKQQTEQQEVQATRTFTVPKKERDMWVGAISKALLLHEKQKAKVRKAVGSSSFVVVTSNKSNTGATAVECETVAGATMSPRTATAMPESVPRPWSPIYDSIWSGDRFMTLDKPTSPARLRMGSPPSSPRPASKRPLPRHDVLAGESLA